MVKADKRMHRGLFTPPKGLGFLSKHEPAMLISRTITLISSAPRLIDTSNPAAVSSASCMTPSRSITRIVVVELQALMLDTYL